MCLVHVGVGISGLRLSRAPGGGENKYTVVVRRTGCAALRLPGRSFLLPDSFRQPLLVSRFATLRERRVVQDSLDGEGEGIPDPGVFGRVLAGKTAR